MSDSRRSRKRTARPRWLSDVPAWEHREVRRHLDPSTNCLRTDHRTGPIPLGQAHQRRREGEPLEYILGHVHVGPVTLRVDERALIPRPETETLVRRVAQRTDRLPPGPLVDCGTGTGFIAGWMEISTDRPVVAVDKYERPLSLAAENRALNDWTFPLVHGDRLGSIGGPVSGVVANLPYVLPDAEELNFYVREYEPSEAYRLTENPIEFYGILIRQARRCLAPHGELWLELDAGLLDRLVPDAVGSGWKQPRIHEDLRTRPRFLQLIRRP